MWTLDEAREREIKHMPVLLQDDDIDDDIIITPVPDKGSRVPVPLLPRWYFESLHPSGERLPRAGGVF
ncbi:MAG: hypothetical protein F4Z73_02625 [Synechococcus sp. SB0668_bin_13]|nr:hypothetical protein [Synechococcus sp. SB0668_bin_13]